MSVKLEDRLVGLVRCPQCGVANPEMVRRRLNQIVDLKACK